MPVGGRGWEGVHAEGLGGVGWEGLGGEGLSSYACRRCRLNADGEGLGNIQRIEHQGILTSARQARFVSCCESARDRDRQTDRQTERDRERERERAPGPQELLELGSGVRAYRYHHRLFVRTVCALEVCSQGLLLLAWADLRVGRPKFGCLLLEIFV